MLTWSKVTAGYAGRPVVFDVSLEVNPGEAVAVLGPNGAGKSTLLKAAAGLCDLVRGEIILDGQRLSARSPAQRVAEGLVYLPQGRNVFASLSVEENLAVSAGYLARRSQVRRLIDSLFDFAPSLRPARHQMASTLSAGYKQLLALCRVLIRQPRYVLLDEPTLGLSPSLADELLNFVKRLIHEHSVGVVVVGHDASRILAISSRFLVLHEGRATYSGAGQPDQSRLMQVLLPRTPALDE